MLSLEILSKKNYYRGDALYNLMQVGLMFYLMLFSFRVNYSKIYVNSVSLQYFNINYIILSILFLVILLYSFIELRNINDQ